MNNNFYIKNIWLLIILYNKLKHQENKILKKKLLNKFKKLFQNVFKQTMYDRVDDIDWTI